MQIICSHRIQFHRPVDQVANVKHETVIVKASPDIQEVPDWVAETDHFRELEDEGIIRQVEVKSAARREKARAAVPDAPGLQGDSDPADSKNGRSDIETPAKPAPAPDASVTISTGRSKKS